MEPIVVATWGLVIVTLLLVIATFVGIARAERTASAQRKELTAQTSALVTSAKATQAMADEMLEARRAEHPLELDVELTDDAQAGVFGARLTRTGPAGIILISSEILVGPDRLPAADLVRYGNFYLGGSAEEVGIHETFERQGRDLLTLRVTGIPENGLEQSVEFYFRILPSGKFERLSAPRHTQGVGVAVAAAVNGPELIVGVTNTGIRPVSVKAVGVTADKVPPGFTDWRQINHRRSSGGGIMLADPPLPVMLDVGAPAYEVKAPLSRVKGTLFPRRAEWIWSTDSYGTTRWSPLPDAVADAIAVVSRRVLEPDSSGSSREVVIGDDEDLAGRPLS